MHDDQVDVSPEQLRTLLRAQQPQWADLPVTRIASSGTDNTIYRLGDDLVVRMPLIEWAVPQIELEHTWLPRLAPQVPVALHEPVALGEPGAGYPWHWSIYRWLDGEDADHAAIEDRVQLARDVAGFVLALRQIDPAGVPRSGRGIPLRLIDGDTRGAIEKVRHELDGDVLLAAWEDALAAPKWDRDFVPLHGDLTGGNLVIRDGRLHAVIDFSLFGLGDPAVDLAVAWDLLDAESRAVFLDELEVDDATRRRAIGWVVRAVFGLVYYERTNPGIVLRCRRWLQNVIDDVTA
jgi:aminoglycoside phosphotransferase (APT) family kinase protein